MPDRRLFLLLAAMALAFDAAPIAPAQPPPPPPGGAMQIPPDKPDPSVQVPSFDVISVKPDTTNGGMMRLMFTGDGFSVTNVPVHMLLTESYHLNDDQILGEPAWTRNDHFDVEAKVAGPDIATLKKLTLDQRRSMFKQVLTDRFQLITHTETRTLPVYVLSVAKGGPKLTVSVPDIAAPDSAAPAAPGSAALRPRGPRIMMNRGKLTATGGQLSFLAQFLSQQLGRTVIDKTGLTGDYDFTLEWTPDEAVGGPQPAGAATEPAPEEGDAPPPTSSGPSIFTAIREQLGLKLESTKGPVPVLVIDHIERPTPN